MGFISSTIKKIVLWNYPRTSWQWDVLCVLILVFIFLTPKSWFANTSYDPHTQAKVFLGAELIGDHADEAEIGRRARELAKRPNAQVIKIQPTLDSSGKLTGYEVDIR